MSHDYKPHKWVIQGLTTIRADRAFGALPRIRRVSLRCNSHLRTQGKDGIVREGGTQSSDASEGFGRLCRDGVVL